MNVVPTVNMVNAKKHRRSTTIAAKRHSLTSSWSCLLCCLPCTCSRSSNPFSSSSVLASNFLFLSSIPGYFQRVNNLLFSYRLSSSSFLDIRVLVLNSTILHVILSVLDRVVKSSSFTDNLLLSVIITDSHKSLTSSYFDLDSIRTFHTSFEPEACRYLCLCLGLQCRNISESCCH